MLKINPLVLILFNLVTPVLAFVHNSTALHVVLFSFVSILLVASGKGKRFLQCLAFYLLVYALEIVLGLWLKLQAISLMVFMLRQFMPFFMAGSILSLDYNSAELLSALQLLRLPRIFLVALTVTLRYIPTFRREFAYMKESMRIRGIPFTLKKPLHSFQYFIVPQLFRCMILAEELCAAGMVKGINNPSLRSSYFDTRIHLSDCLLIAVFLIAGLGVVLWTV